jgi:glycosyltransferase involved in cell wall biosynthesis
MKIIILIPIFLPKWLGGAEIMTQNIAIDLAKKGHEVHVITLLDKGLKKLNLENEFYIHRINKPNIKILGQLIFWFKSFLLIIKLKPEIVLVEYISFLNSLISYLSKKIFKIPYILQGHGSDIYNISGMKKLILKYLSKDASAVFVLTKDMENEVRKFYHGNVFIIPNGLDQKFLDNVSKNDLMKSKIRTKLNLNQKLVLLFIGSLRTIKGVKYLINAIPQIKKFEKDVILLVVGNGPQKKELEMLVQNLNLNNNVRFFGKINRNHISPFYSIADIFILPSLSEGFPTVLLEAMAFGIPIIATNINGINEIIKNNKNGFLVNPKDPRNIAEKVLELNNKKVLYSNISNNNYKEIEKYRFDKIVSILEEICIKSSLKD